MPHSSDAFDQLIKTQLLQWNYKRYLDIGCGAGKYGRMIRELLPDSHIEGVEIDSEYIEMFHLKQTYNKILNTGIQSLLAGPQAVTYDAVVFGNVIEHLLKSDGINALHFFAYR